MDTIGLMTGSLCRNVHRDPLNFDDVGACCPRVLGGSLPTSRLISSSHANIAAQLGVTKASLHYHFPSKAELGRALIERYRSLFGAALDAIDQQAKEPHEKLKQYVGLYNSVLSNERMCLCGMLAAEYATLPAPMQEGLKLFFDANERWLSAVLEDGHRAGTFLFREPASERARVLLGALEGAMLVARSYDNPRRFQ